MSDPAIKVLLSPDGQPLCHYIVVAPRCAHCNLPPGLQPVLALTTGNILHQHCYITWASCLRN